MTPFDLNKIPFYKKNLHPLSDWLLFLDILLILGLAGVACFYIDYPEGDMLEHLYASYRVFLGEIPYRDFFEHHHPLLWYLFIPVYKVLDFNTEVSHFANYITLLFFVFGLYYLYRTMVEFMGGRTAGLLAAILTLVPFAWLYYLYFKPDQYMLVSLIVGGYYFLCYFRDKKRSDLIISYLWFYLSYLFLQKALLYFPVFGVMSLYGLYCKQIRGKDFALALVLPVFMTLVLVGFIVHHGFWEQYIKLNYTLNSELPKYFGQYAVNKSSFWMAKTVFGAAILSGLIFYKSGGRAFRMYCWLFALIFASRFYFAPFIYYWYEPYVFACVVASAGVCYLAEKKKMLLYLLVLELQVYVGLIAYYIVHDINFNIQRWKYPMTEYVLSHANRCDYVLSSKFLISFFHKSPLYYWFQNERLPVIGEDLGIHPKENYTDIVLKYKPLFIYVEDIYNWFNIDEEELIGSFDMEKLQELYEPVEYSSFYKPGTMDDILEHKKSEYAMGLWKLKLKYRQKTCRLDEATGIWSYVD